ncbi:sensor histidine kinase [Pseudonocardia charpentierae]|uniref:histidine kinase n=1 Tax=Pseudonocardia charpentierae TaxID=3075545 RepID=A0ABU2NCY4_9PSEU|nr:HAMP domain-containing sensor histidine kinase [Pseudonocardia sp. DSM 45834]MDT0351810.1 HAMP domain-containing sensor histidine kinase [Pseudonocardia sp. DSM 45834]
MRALRAAREWWARRTLRVRITLTVGTVALVALLALSRFATVLAFGVLVDATDQELRTQSLQAVARLDDGATAVPGVRVVDMAGQAVDEGPPLPLDGRQVAQLAAGEGVTTQRFSAPRRWIAELAIAPDGTPRLAVASADLVGGTALTRRAAGLAVFGAVLAALVVAGAAWVATRAALRPVDRLRTAAAALPPGDRLPMPAATDEVRALAQELNALLARRDEAVARLERFTGDAAHELRSPVAAIRAQAEVAVAHPDPALADETLRAVAVEAERLTDMLADLMALARADAGQRPSPRPVDVVAAARAAIGRQNRHGAVVKLVAPAPAAAAASPGEVALVLDNLLGNALRHARGLVQVGVLPAGRTVRLVVEDDGPGIPAADRDRVFDRFTRLEPDVESRAGGGAGLGLALVAALVAGRGGTVAAGEAPGGGARMEVRWPAAARP